MRLRIPAPLATLGCALILAAPGSAQSPASEDIVLRGVTVIDGVSDEPTPGQSIHVSKGRIVAVGPNVEVGPDVREIDARGQWVIPGLWDLTVALDDSELWKSVPPPPADEKERLLPLFLCAGVTGVRNFGGDLDLLHEWRTRIDAGELNGPTILCSGPWIDGASSSKPGALLTRNPGNAGRAVTDLAERGVDFVALASNLTPEAFLAAARIARERGLPFSGRIPRTANPLQVAESGMSSVGNLAALVRGMYDYESTRTRIMAIDLKLEPAERRNKQIEIFFDGIVEEKKIDLLRTLRDAGTAVIPSLVCQKRRAFCDPSSPDVQPYIDFVPPYLRSWWAPANNPDLRDFSETWMLGERAMLAGYVHLVGDMIENDVEVLPGTDFGGNPLVIPGFALHDELVLLVSAGMKPMQAIQAATSKSARFLGLGADFGSVAPGKFADFIVLDRNPLERIAHTRAIAAVSTRGKYFDREALDALLEANRREPVIVPVAPGRQTMKVRVGEPDEHAGHDHDDHDDHDH